MQIADVTRLTVSVSRIADVGTRGIPLQQLLVCITEELLPFGHRWPGKRRLIGERVNDEAGMSGYRCKLLILIPGHGAVIIVRRPFSVHPPAVIAAEHHHALFVTDVIPGLVVGYSDDVDVDAFHVPDILFRK